MGFAGLPPAGGFFMFIESPDVADYSRCPEHDRKKR